MGMSTHVVGFAPPDATWRKMKAIWDSCQEAEIQCPPEVEKYFGGEPPDESGVTVELMYPKQHESVTEWSAEMCSGYEIDISKLPKHVKIIRVYNSF